MNYVLEYTDIETGERHAVFAEHLMSLVHIKQVLLIEPGLFSDIQINDNI